MEEYKRITYWTKWESGFTFWIMFLIATQLSILSGNEFGSGFALGGLGVYFILEKIYGWENIIPGRIQSWK